MVVSDNNVVFEPYGFYNIATDINNILINKTTQHNDTGIGERNYINGYFDGLGFIQNAYGTLSSDNLDKKSGIRNNNNAHKIRDKQLLD